MIKCPLLNRRFQKIYVYRTEQSYLLLCMDQLKNNNKIVSISRTSIELSMKMFQETYTFREGLHAVAKILIEEEGARKNETASYVLSKFFVCKCYGILGYPRFLDGHYLFLITKRAKVADLLGGSVYRVVEAKLENVLNQERSCLYRMTSTKSAEIKYIEYFNYMDVSGFYFSYDLDLTNSFQRQFQARETGVKCELDDTFVWNSYITSPLEGMQVCSELLLPVIYGYAEFKPMRIGSRDFTLGIVSRRGRFNAGTRFLRRGINEQGNVANFVETELILLEYFPMSNELKTVNAFAFVRGSIPLFWGHEKSAINPKPKIIMSPERDPQFAKTESHFKSLCGRYGETIFCLNLVKKGEKSSEFALGAGYKNFIDLASRRRMAEGQRPNLRWEWLDFFAFYQRSEKMLIRQVQKLAREDLKVVSLFHRSALAGKPRTQDGVIRVNCVDCLDRTNNVMAIISSVVLAKMLRLCGVENQNVFDENIRAVKDETMSVLFEMWGVC